MTITHKNILVVQFFKKIIFARVNKLFIISIILDKLVNDIFVVTSLNTVNYKSIISSFSRVGYTLILK